MSGMRTPLALIHNEAAGDVSHDRNWLVETLSRAGYEVGYHRHDAAGVAAALDGGAELIAVAGGDGTVAKVAAQGRPDSPRATPGPTPRRSRSCRSVRPTISPPRSASAATSTSLRPGGAAARC